jgi:TatD DNase family protein
MHCFSGDDHFAKACLDRGAYLSFAGTITFKNNDHLRDALTMAPRDRILVETDAPYLTPMPLRGRPNASYLIPHTARFLAATLKIDVDRCVRRSTTMPTQRSAGAGRCRWSSARCCAGAG